MNARTFALVLIIVSLVAVSHLAQTQSPVALSGRINSSDGAAMEGVLVSAKKAGSTITTTVVSDEQGRVSVPFVETAAGPVCSSHSSGRLRSGRPARQSRSRAGKTRLPI